MSFLYKISITGIQDGFSEKITLQQLSTLFKTPVNKLENVLKSNKFTVKRGLDAKSVEKYETALKECGCLCLIEEEFEEIEKFTGSIEEKMDMIFCRGCGKKIHTSASNCPNCGEKKEVSTHYVNAENLIPHGVKGWSWGAFWLNWIWAIGNRTWVGLLAFIPIVNLVIPIVLGLKGREWAWKNKQWENFEHFDRVQKKWSFWGWMFFFISLFISLVAFSIIIGIPRYEEYKNSQSKEFQSSQVPTLILAPTSEPILNSEKSKAGIERKVAIGVIQEFLCGDYCYLTILRKDDNSVMTLMGDGGATDSNNEIKKEFQNVEVRMLWHTEKIYIPEGQTFQVVNIVDTIEKVR